MSLEALKCSLTPTISGVNGVGMKVASLEETAGYAREHRMLLVYQILLIALAGLVALRLGMTLREREFAQALLADGAGWTRLNGPDFLGIRRRALWKRYLWSLRWRRLSDSPFDVAAASDLRASCARWLAFDAVTGIAFVGLLLVLWKVGAVH